jgi:hypothetical protein
MGAWLVLLLLQRNNWGAILALLAIAAGAWLGPFGPWHRYWYIIVFRMILMTTAIAVSIREVVLYVRSRHVVTEHGLTTPTPTA